MAVEIKELVIRAVVDYQQERDNGATGNTGEQTDAERELIIQACVRRVLKMINHANKR